MHKRAFQGLKRTFIHVSGLPPPYFENKKSFCRVIGFFFKTWWGKTRDMHKRAFQGLKRTFIHVSGLPPPYFENKKSFCRVIGFLSKHGGGRPETCINVRFRA